MCEASFMFKCIEMCDKVSYFCSKTGMNLCHLEFSFDTGLLNWTTFTGGVQFSLCFASFFGIAKSYMSIVNLSGLYPFPPFLDLEKCPCPAIQRPPLLDV